MQLQVSGAAVSTPHCQSASAPPAPPFAVEPPFAAEPPSAVEPPFAAEPPSAVDPPFADEPPLPPLAVLSSPQPTQSRAGTRTRRTERTARDMLQCYGRYGPASNKNVSISCSCFFATSRPQLNMMVRFFGSNTFESGMSLR